MLEKEDVGFGEGISIAFVLLWRVYHPQLLTSLAGKALEEGLDILHEARVFFFDLIY